MVLAHALLALVSGKVVKQEPWKCRSSLEAVEADPVEAVEAAEADPKTPEPTYECIRRLIVETDGEEAVPDFTWVEADKKTPEPTYYECIRRLIVEPDNDAEPVVKGRTPPDYMEKCRALDLMFLETKLVEDGDFHEDDVHEAVEAYRDYFCLMAAPEMENKGLAASGPIDKVWHAHILFTKKYFKHTNEVAGRYIHHEPCGHSMTAEERREGEEAYQNTFLAYKKVFGDKAPSKYWPGAQKTEVAAAQKSSDEENDTEASDEPYYGHQCIRRL